MSEDNSCSVFTPVTQLVSNMSELRTKRLLRHTPARHSPYPSRISPKSASNSTDSNATRSDHKQSTIQGPRLALNQLQNFDETSASGRLTRKNPRPDGRKAPKNSVESETDTTPRKSREVGQCPMDLLDNPAGAVASHGAVSTTPLSSYACSTRSKTAKRAAAKAKAKHGRKEDRENVPPCTLPPQLSNKNQRSLFPADRAPGKNLFGGMMASTTGGDASLQRPDDRILSPVSSSSKRGKITMFDFDNPSSKRPRAEPWPGTAYDDGMAEADAFDAIAFIEDGRKTAGGGFGPEAVVGRFCSRLNFCDFEAEEATVVVGIEQSRTEDFQLESMECEWTESKSGAETSWDSPLERRSQGERQSRTGNEWESPLGCRIESERQSRTETYWNSPPGCKIESERQSRTGNEWESPLAYKSESERQSRTGSSSARGTEETLDDSLARIEEHYLMQERPDATGLPLVKGRRHDCNSISAETLRNVINGDYKGVFDEYVIVDCRYPYEYEGGHVKDAVNVYTREGVSDMFMADDRVQSGLKSLLIFHCEFSSERGPRLMQHLRSVDRMANLSTYPSLYYPEVYLLDGGYKAFFEAFPTMCEPRDYKPMTHEDHVVELRQFKAKARSLPTAATTDGCGGSGTTSRAKKDGARAGRRRCLGESDLSPMETEEGSAKVKAKVKAKKNPRALFFLGGSKSEGTCPVIDDDLFDLRAIDS